MKSTFYSFLLISFLWLFQYCTSSHNTKLTTNTVTDTLILKPNSQGNEINLNVTIGNEHNHPLMAFWITTSDTVYIQTLYVAKSIAKGIYEHGDESEGKWLPGERRRPASLPYWAYNRGIREEDGLFIPTTKTPIPDAYTGATPQNNFIIESTTDHKALPDSIIVFFEINQTWDWNEYWTNNKFPEDNEYKTSSQPALVFAATISTKTTSTEVPLTLIGNSSYNGSNGNLYNQLSTITTAKDIISSISVSFTSEK